MWRPHSCRRPDSLGKTLMLGKIQFSQSFQWLSRVRLFATPWIAAPQASLSITNSWSSPKFMFIELVMPSSHLTLCHPLLLPPSIFPSIRIFSNELVLRIRWPKFWSFTFSISLSSEYSGLISFRMDWFDLLAVQGILKKYQSISTQWTWVWVSSRSWWWKGKSGMLQSMGVQRVGHDWVTELSWQDRVNNAHECWGWLGLELTEWVSESHSVVSDSLWPHGLYNPWNSPGQNSGVDNFSLIQGIFPTRDQTQASYIAGRFSTSWATREALRGDLESAINSCIQTVKSYSNSCQSFPRKMFQSFKCSKEIIYLVVQ